MNILATNFFLIIGLLCSSVCFSQERFFEQFAQDSLSNEDRMVMEDFRHNSKTCEADTCKFSKLLESILLLNTFEVQKKYLYASLDYLSDRIALHNSSTEMVRSLKALEIEYYAELVNCYLTEANYKKTIQLNGIYLERSEALKDTFGIVSAFNNFAYIHQLQGDTEGALQFYAKLVELATQAKLYDVLPDLYSNYSSAYYEVGSFDLAVEYFKKGLVFPQESVPLISLINIYGNLGVCYISLNELDSASLYLNKSIELAKEEKDLESLYSAKSSQVTLLEAQNKFEKAEYIAKETLDISIELEDITDIIESLGVLSDIKVKLGKYKEAYELTNREVELKETLWKEEDIIALSQLESDLKYESEITLNKEKNESLERESSLKSNIIYLSIALLVIIGLFSVFLIINRRKLKQNKLRLEQLDKVNKQIFSVIAHDFKEPIINFNLLLKDIENKQTLDDDFIQELESQVKSSSHVLNNLLNWARIELAKQEVNKKKINLSDLWSDVISTMETSIKKKALTVKNLADSEDSIVGDVVMMEIVFRNLISNAIKFSPKHGTITLRNQNGSIHIEDEGIGMNQTNTDKLFKEKVNTQYGTNGETGFGIGLFIVNMLLKKNEKTISFSANTPKGTIFSIQDI
ncbi:MAG: tetratricopeptide repeat-containing sensor histidine kinase [Flavobacteriales bacterium]